ncbi:MAG: HIT family protein [Bacteroidia bacterium]
MASIFTKIVNGELPSYKIAETEKFLAFLNIYPLVEGHTLVIPKKEIDYIFDLDDELLKELFVFAKKVGLAIEKVIPCKRIGISVIGLEVSHAHIHLIPLNKMSDMNFDMPKLSFSPDEFNTTASAISKSFLSLYK